MKKLLLIVPFVLLTACASNAELAVVQAQVDSIRAKQDTLASDISIANNNAKAAKAASEHALEVCKQINAKLDRVFKKAQFK